MLHISGPSHIGSFLDGGNQQLLVYLRKQPSMLNALGLPSGADGRSFFHSSQIPFNMAMLATDQLVQIFGGFQVYCTSSYLAVSHKETPRIPKGKFSESVCGDSQPCLGTARIREFARHSAWHRGLAEISLLRLSLVQCDTLLYNAGISLLEARCGNYS